MIFSNQFLKHWNLQICEHYSFLIIDVIVYQMLFLYFKTHFDDLGFKTHFALAARRVRVPICFSCLIIFPALSWTENAACAPCCLNSTPNVFPHVRAWKSCKNVENWKKIFKNFWRMESWKLFTTLAGVVVVVVVVVVFVVTFGDGVVRVVVFVVSVVLQPSHNGISQYSHLKKIF